MFGLSTIQTGLAGLAVGAIAAGALLWQPRYDAGYEKAAQKAAAVIQTRNTTIATRDSELAQCRAANTNYHLAVGEQLKIIADDLAADRVRQAEAATKNGRADAVMLDAAKKSAENSAVAREAIRNAVEVCLRSNYPADYVGMLNAILPAAGSAPVGGNPLPGK